METRFHAVASGFLSLAIIGLTGSVSAAVSAFAVGVLIDLDHIAMACYKHRTLDPIRLAVVKAFTFSLPEIFETYPIYSVARIISVHTIIGIVLVISGVIVDITVGVAIAGSVLLHILMDMYDGWEHL